MEFEFAHDVGAVRFGGFDTDPQSYGDFLAALALGEQLHDFPLAGGETAAKNGHVVGDSVLLAEAVEKHVRSARSEEGAMIAQGFNGGDEVAVGVRLHDVSANASFDDVADQLIGEVKGQDDDFGLGLALANAPGSFQAVELRHADVHYNNIRLVLFGKIYRFAASLGLSNYIPPLMRGQQLFESAPDNIVVVSN